MLNKILDFFNDNLQADKDEECSHSKLQLACAALLIEISMADHTLEDRELQTLLKILSAQFQLPETQLNELVTLAQEEQSQATSLYQFTRLINDGYQPREKYQLMVNMWQIAYADGHLDKYEEYMIRRISELTYVSHSDFIRAKQEAKSLLNK